MGCLPEPVFRHGASATHGFPQPWRLKSYFNKNRNGAILLDYQLSRVPINFAVDNWKIS